MARDGRGQTFVEFSSHGSAFDKEEQESRKGSIQVNRVSKERAFHSRVSRSLDRNFANFSAAIKTIAIATREQN